jgi:hypothetical protein
VIKKFLHLMITMQKCSNCPPCFCTVIIRCTETFWSPCIIYYFECFEIKGNAVEKGSRIQFLSHICKLYKHYENLHVQLNVQLDVLFLCILYSSLVLALHVSGAICTHPSITSVFHRYTQLWLYLHLCSWGWVHIAPGTCRAKNKEK